MIENSDGTAYRVVGAMIGWYKFLPQLVKHGGNGWYGAYGLLAAVSWTVK